MQYLAQMAHVPRHIIEQLKGLHRKFLWNNRLPKIKHSTLIGEYYDGGLKDIDIEAKFKALKLTWIKGYVMIVIIHGKLLQPNFLNSHIII